MGLAGQAARLMGGRLGQALVLMGALAISLVGICVAIVALIGGPLPGH